MNYRFSSNQKIIPCISIVGIAISGLLILFMLIMITGDLTYKNILMGAMSLLVGIPLMVGSIILLIKSNLFLTSIEINQQGCSLVSKNRKTKQFVKWKDISRIIIAEKGEEKYICFSSNARIHPAYMQIPGIIWVSLYIKGTISFPVDSNSIASLRAIIPSFHSRVEYAETHGYKKGSVSNGTTPVLVFCAIILLLLLLGLLLIFD